MDKKGGGGGELPPIKRGSDKLRRRFQEFANLKIVAAKKRDDILVKNETFDKIDARRGSADKQTRACVVI